MSDVGTRTPGRHARAGARTASASAVGHAQRRHTGPPDRQGQSDRQGPPTGTGRAGRWLVPLAPAVLGIVTGGYHLGTPPLWRDEGTTKAIASRSVAQILATLKHSDIVHGAYYLVIHVVIRVFGGSNTALRLPSMLAMAIAAGFTALIAQRLAATAGRWQAAGAGVIAGIVFAVLPGTIRYAQEARSYAIATMLVTIATCLLLRATDDGRPRLWAWYGAAVLLTGLCNILGLLIVAAHGLTLLVIRRPGRRLPGLPRGWLAAAAAGGAALVPVIIVAYQQRNALRWMSSPVPARRALIALTRLWAGSTPISWLVFGLAAIGVAASLTAGWRTVSPATVALPWMVIPPAVLLTVSQVRPVYDQRYVEYCLPALAICTAAGITGLWRGTALLAAGHRWVTWLGLAMTAAATVALVVALQPADTAVRLPIQRPDNLENEAQIIADNYKPGDIVFFIPINDRVVSLPFPGPWRKLRDIALRTSPVASNTLYGTDVSPAMLRRRFTHVTRVWIVASAKSKSDYLSFPAVTPVDEEEVRLIRTMRKVYRWRDGDTELTLYTARHRHRSQRAGSAAHA